MPALSMPNNEIGQDQKQCNCQNSQKDCKQMGHGQDGKEKSSDCQKSMIGEDGKQMGEGQDGKEKSSDCHKSMMGEDGKKMGEGQDGKGKSPNCHKSMMGNKESEDKTEIKIIIINVNT